MNNVIGFTGLGEVEKEIRELASDSAFDLALSEVSRRRLDLFGVDIILDIMPVFREVSVANFREIINGIPIYSVHIAEDLNNPIVLGIRYDIEQSRLEIVDVELDL